MRQIAEERAWANAELLRARKAAEEEAETIAKLERKVILAEEEADEAREVLAEAVQEIEGLKRRLKEAEGGEDNEL